MMFNAMLRQRIVPWSIAAIFTFTVISMVFAYSRGYIRVGRTDRRVELRNSFPDKLFRFAVVLTGGIGAFLLLRSRAAATTFFMVAMLGRAAVVLYDAFRFSLSRHVGLFFLIEFASLTFYVFCFAYSYHRSSRR